MAEFERFRDEMRRLDEEAASDEEVELSEQEKQIQDLLLRSADHVDLSQATVDLLLLGDGDGGWDVVGADERGRARVARAMDALRARTHEPIAELLAAARRERRIPVPAAAGVLGVMPQTLDRIEGGQTALLRNLEPDRLASYVRRLGVDAMRIIDGLFPGPEAGPVYGYAPRASEEDRAAAQTRGTVPSERKDRDWIYKFLKSAGVAVD